MTPVQILDVLGPFGNGPAADDPRLGPCVDVLVASLLGEIRLIRELDGKLGGPVPRKGALSTPDPAAPPEFDRPAAEFLRRLYEEWAVRAGELLDRISGLYPRGAITNGLDELFHEHGRVMAMLSVPLDDLFSSLAQARRGRGLTLGEVRELLARDHA
jgi:hypothetical protein